MTTTTSPTVEETQARIEAALSPDHFEINDDSHHHAGHQGDRALGGAHLTVTVVATAFTGKSLVERHRMVYAAVGDLMQQQIHALSMQTHSPEEWAGR
ncbi:MAG: BolA family transcriptional regulator [Candidatus Marinimicrobia bacterium]|nr:BolA family transcriptional regulator [Candidatus Neomarinimicrobiota bacterium]